MRKFLICLLAMCLFTGLSYHVVQAAEIEISPKIEATDLYKEKIQAQQVFHQSENEVYVTDDDVYLMAQIVYAESRSEPFEGKVAVASVILNRAKNPKFPHTIEGVIKQPNAFSCVVNGRINVVPDESSYKAVLAALKGNDPTSEAVFYYNPRTATSTWMINVPKMNVKTIGHHVFFATK